MAIFVVDIGNRRVKLALVSFEDEIVHRMHFLTTEIEKHTEAIRNLAHDERVQGVVIGSSVPRATEIILAEVLEKNPLVVSGATPTELNLDYEPPNSLGADRLAAAVGAYHIYGKVLKRTIMIVDAGSAVTADLVSHGGVLQGGAIFPGDAIALNALAEGTAKLEKIEFAPEEAIIGKNTAQCILVGVRASVVGAIEHLYRRYGDLHGERPFMLLTGASAAWIAPELSIPHMVDPDIVLIGLAAIWSYNRKSVER